MSWSISVNLACMKRSMSTQLWQCVTSPQSTQSGSTLTKHLRESRCKSFHELLPESGGRPHLSAGTPSLEALKAIISIAASHSPEFSLMLCSGGDTGKIGLLKKSMYGTRDAASNWARDGQAQLGRSSRSLSHNKKRKNLGFDTRRLRGDRIDGSVGKKRLESSQSKRASSGQGRQKEYQGDESESTLGRDRDIVSARSTTRCLRRESGVRGWEHSANSNS